MVFIQQHRVVIYNPCYNVLDGVTLTIRKLENELLASGHLVCVLTAPSGDPANSHFHLDGNRQHPNRRLLFLENAQPIPFLHDPNNPKLSYKIGFSLTRNMKRQLDDFDPSIIHIAVPDCTALHLIEYARRKEVPLMGTYHSNIPEYMDHYPGFGWLKPILAGFFRHQYNFMQALYVPTPFIRRHLCDAYHLDRATRLGIWGRGVDAEKFHPDFRYAAGGKFRVQLGLNEEDVVLCWVGRLVPEKRTDIFCDTVRRLHDDGLNFHAVVVGAGPCEDEVKTLPNTTFCGWMNAEQLAVAYASSDVFLFPSSVETFGNVTLEAMASGLPVVVDEGCSGHLVEQGVNGYACPEGDADAYYEAVKALICDRTKRILFGRNSRAKAEQLEKQTVVRQMLEHYDALQEEFYTEYGGHHANRDKVTEFEAGNHPRPILLIMVEYLFVVLFGVLFNMSQVIYWFLDFTRSRGGTGSVATLAETTVPLREPSTTSVSSSKTFGKSTAATRSTATTSSSDDTTEAEPPRRNSCDPCMLLAVSFVNTMYFVCRTESRIRNSLSSCGSRTLRFRKRKNSFHIASEGETLEIERTRSRMNGGSMDAGSRHGLSTRRGGQQHEQGSHGMDTPLSPSSGSTGLLLDV